MVRVYSKSLNGSLIDYLMSQVIRGDLMIWSSRWPLLAFEPWRGPMRGVMARREGEVEAQKLQNDEWCQSDEDN